MCSVGEIANNDYAKFWGAKGVYIMGLVQVVNLVSRKLGLKIDQFGKFFSYFG